MNKLIYEYIDENYKDLTEALSKINYVKNHMDNFKNTDILVYILSKDNSNFKVKNIESNLKNVKNYNKECNKFEYLMSFIYIEKIKDFDFSEIFLKFLKDNISKNKCYSIIFPYMKYIKLLIKPNKDTFNFYIKLEGKTINENIFSEMWDLPICCKDRNDLYDLFVELRQALRDFKNDIPTYISSTEMMFYFDSIVNFKKLTFLVLDEIKNEYIKYAKDKSDIIQEIFINDNHGVYFAEHLIYKSLSNLKYILNNLKKEIDI